jgi:hypothetical protein
MIVNLLLHATFENQVKRMKYLITTLLCIMLIASISKDSNAQWTMSLGGSGYYFLDSKDNNIHPGINLRGGLDFDRYQLDFGLSYFFPVISTVPTKVYEKNPVSPYFRQFKNITNAVTGITYNTSVQMNYFIWGQPIGGQGIYGFMGGSYFVYYQQNNLSIYDPKQFYPADYLNGSEYYRYQLLFDFGFGAKFPMRQSSFFVEGKLSIPTNPYKEHGLAIETSVLATVTAGIRMHLVTRKNRYERINLGRTGKQRQKSAKRMRR